MMFKFLRRLIVLGFVVFCGYQMYMVYKSVQSALQYKGMIKGILNDNNTTTSANLVLAMIYTETRGDDGDVTQPSKSSDGVANLTTDSQTSIRQGVTASSENLTLVDEAGVDAWTTVWAYNFGIAYIDYVAENSGENMIALATAYSRDVVVPNLGDTTGEAYFHCHPLALVLGGKLYKNGGNIYYSRGIRSNLYLIELASLF